MDQTADISCLPIDFDGSVDPNRLPEITLGNHSLMATMEQVSPVMSKASGDRLSPVRGRTMKEYDQQISDLKKENFSLKMRIYYMEDRMQQRFGDGQDVFKTNIELQVEIDNLKRELADKQVLVQKAALAMETLTAKHEQEEELLRGRLMAGYIDEMNQLRDQLDKANQNCIRSRKEVEEAESQLQMTKQQLMDVKRELTDSHKTNKELSTKVKDTEFEVQVLTDHLKEAEMAKDKLDKENLVLSQTLKDLEDQLQSASKESTRKDRDILDELEDQKAAVAKKDEKIADLENQLRKKDGVVQNLEDAVKELEDKKKDTEKALNDVKSELEKKNMQFSRLKKSIEGVVKSLELKSKECQDQKSKLAEAEKEVKLLQDALKEAELDKTKTLDSISSQLAEAEASNERLTHQLMEANETSENLVKSLGKKESELAGFQEQLCTAMEALTKSEEAVETLQAQLKSERAYFDNKLREQAIHFQVSGGNTAEPVDELEGLRQQIVDLQKLIASQNIELLALARERDVVGDLREQLKEKDADIGLMSAEHKRELSELERELSSLRAELSGKDMKIQALEDHRVWLEEHQRETLQKLRETSIGGSGIHIQDLSVSLLQDIKLLMDLLRREISSLATLQLQLRELNNSEHGVSREALTTEISTIQRIYRQLEEGVEKNSRLHHTLLISLRAEHRLSDSPDSNSCQDGGYNLGPATHQSKQTSLSSSPEMRLSRSPQQKSAKSGKAAAMSESLSSLESEWESPPVSQSVAVETCPDLTDRSQQTGSSFCHIDQWVQTSPRVDENNLNEVTETKEPALGEKIHNQEKHKHPFSDSEEDIRRHYIFGHHNDSLTDDAKEEHLGMCTDGLEDYHNFQHGVYFDEHHLGGKGNNSFSAGKHDLSQTSSSGKSAARTGYTVCNSSKSGDFEYLNINTNGKLSPEFLPADVSKAQNGNISDADEPDGSYCQPESGTRFGNGALCSGRGNTSFCTDTNSQMGKINESLKIKAAEMGVSPLLSYTKSSDAIHLKSVLSSDKILVKNTTKTPSVIEEQKQNSQGKENTKVNGENNRRVHNTQTAEREDNGKSGFTGKGGAISGDCSETEVRSRRSSWAEELEQYKVQDHHNHHHEPSPRNMTSTKFAESSRKEASHSLPRNKSKNIANMSSSELRSLLVEMQIDLTDAMSQNHDLQQQLSAYTSIHGSLHADPQKAAFTGNSKTDVSTHNQSHRSRIPRPLVTSNNHSTNISCNNSDILQMSLRTGGQYLGGGEPSVIQALDNFESLDSDKTENSSSARECDGDIRNLSGSYDQIRELQEKLLESEETVKLLSKKNETYLSALHKYGIDCCLDPLLTSVDMKSSSVGNLTTLVSEQDNVDSRSLHSVASGEDHSRDPGTAESMERPRYHLPTSLSHSDNGSHRSSTTSIVTAISVTSTQSPDSTTKNAEFDVNTVASTEQIQEEDKSPKFKNINLAVSMSTLSPINESVDLMNTARPASTDLTSDAESSWPQESKQRNGASPSKINKQDNSSARARNAPHQNNHKDDACDGDKSSFRHVSFSQGHNTTKFNLDSSMLDRSAYPDVTYSSMLDSTIMHKLLANVDHNMSTLREDALSASSLSFEQLQIRVEHLERVNLTLREEIGVYEALHRSQGTQVSSSLSEEGSREGKGVTEEDLLKQHLIEIRKLRERLERLDVTKDPEQLLIFQSHTQQRIARQEMIISHLQQQILEKEELHHQQLAEMQHKLSREKTLLVEKLEVKISELQKTIRGQISKIAEQDRRIMDLQSELNVKEEREKKKDEELKRMINEKAELECDLLTRDKEFLDIEKKMFRLEIENENTESKCKRLSKEIEEMESEKLKLKKFIEESKESTVCLKETVVKYEKSVQDKNVSIQKLVSEKASCEHKLMEKDGHMKKLEAELSNLRKEMNKMRVDLEEKVKLKAEINIIKEELKKKESLETRYEFQKVGYKKEIDRISEEKTKLKTQLDAKSSEIEELMHRINELEHEMLGKTALENQILLLKEEVQSSSGLQDEVARLNLQLDSKCKLEAELKDKLNVLRDLQSEIDVLKEKVAGAEESVRVTEEAKKKVVDDLKEREEKLKKRDKQLHHLLGQYKKLDTAFTKQKYSLSEKLELVQSLKKQMHLYEVTLTCGSQEEKDSIMKQLLKELIATQRQVEDLLSRLEQNSGTLKSHTIFMDGFNLTTSSASTTTTLTTTEGGSRHDLIDIPVTTTSVKDNIPERLLDELNRPTSELDHEALPDSIPSSHMSPHCSVLSSQRTSPNHSPRQLKYFVDSDCARPKGNIPMATVCSDIRSLFAVMKLDSHEKLRKETGECLVILSGVEARLGNRLKVYKSKPVSESVEYSTLREVSMSCRNLRLCLEEASQLIGTAWITELPPVDSRGHFYDPVLAEQNENLKHELAQLSSHYDLLDHSLKEQQGWRLNTPGDSSKHWESSLYKQLHKTARDLEQAKENIDTSLTELPTPRKFQSFSQYKSPLKSPRRRLEDTL